MCSKPSSVGCTWANLTPGLGCLATASRHWWLPLFSMGLGLGFGMVSITLATGRITAPCWPEWTHNPTTVDPDDTLPCGVQDLPSPSASWKCQIPHPRSTGEFMPWGQTLTKERDKGTLDNFLILPLPTILNTLFPRVTILFVSQGRSCVTKQIAVFSGEAVASAVTNHFILAFPSVPPPLSFPHALCPWIMSPIQH